MKNLKIIYSLIILCLTMTVFAGCSAKLNNFEILSNSIVTNLEYGQELDFSGLQILANFEDGTSKMITYAGNERSFEIDTTAVNNLVADEYDVTITYKGKSVTFQVNVLEARVTDFVIDRGLIATSFAYGVTPDWSKLVVKAVYQDESEVVLTDDEYFINTSNFNSMVAGSYVITIGYTGFSNKTFNVTVLPATITQISLNYQNVDTSLDYAQELDLTSLIVTGIFADSETEVLDNTEYTVDFGGYNSTTSGNYTITISYNGITAQFIVTVASPQIFGFTFDRSGVSEMVGYGTIPNWSALIVKAVYQDETEVVLTTQHYMLNTSSFDQNQAGTYTISIGYSTFATQSFTVTVLQASETGIEIDYTEVETNLRYLDELDLSNLVVTKIFSDYSEVVLQDTEYEVDLGGFSSTTSGSYTITISYNSFSETFEVSVAEPHIIGFSYSRLQIPDQVDYGVTPDFSLLVVEALYINNTSVVLNSNEYFLNTSNFNATVVGIHAITIGYSTFESLSFTVEVLAPTITSISLDLTSVDCSISYNGELDLSNIIVSAIYADNSIVILSSNEYTIDNGGFDSLISGSYDITITYFDNENIFQSFEVTVLEPQVTGFVIDRSAIASTVSYGSEIDWTNLIVKAVYEDESLETLSAEDYTLNYSLFKSTTIGSYNIYVSYLSFTTQSFMVTVISANSYGNTFAYDGDTLVIFQGINYSLGSSVTNLSYIKDGDTNSHYIGTGSLEIDELGIYTINYLSNGVEKSKSIKVVPWISNFGVGDSLALYNNNISSSTSSFISLSDTIYEVGTADNYYFDIALNNNNITSLDYIDYTFAVNVYDSDSESLSGSFASIDDLIVNSEDDSTYGAGFVFSSKYTNSIVRVTIRPKYNDRSPIVLEFILNDGVNVFSNDELKIAYGNLGVQCINIHRTIICELSSNQTNPDGSPLNYNEWLNSRVTYDGNEMTSNATGNVYVRISDSTSNDNLVINGNYQTIDGSNLPLINLKDYGGVNGQCSSLTDSLGNANGVVNSQIAIFRSQVRSSSGLNLSNLQTTEAYNNINNNNVNYNNLIVIGNTTVPETSQGNELLTNSGSYSAIRTSYNDVTTNNCILKNSCIGMFVTGGGTDIYAVNTKIYESWANLIYSYSGNIVSLTNCQLKNAGGSAVWIEDNDASDYELYNPTFIMDNNTIIDNFVSGSEAWFTAYNMASFVATAKANMESGISSYGKTILKTKDYQDDEGNIVSVEKFNFTVVIIEKFDSVDASSSTVCGSFTIGNIVVEENYGNYPSGAEQFLFDSTSEEFLNMVAYYMSESGGSLDQTTAITLSAIYCSNYLEVVTSVPTYGVLHMIAWMYNVA